MTRSTSKARALAPNDTAKTATTTAFGGGLGGVRSPPSDADAARPPYRRFVLDGDAEAEASAGGPVPGSADLLVGDATGAAGYEILYLLEGSADGVFASRLQPLVAGDIVVVALDRPFVIGFAPSRRISFRVPADRVVPELKAFRLHGLVLQAGVTFGRMIASVMLASCEADPGRRPHDATLSFVLAMLHIAGAAAPRRHGGDAEAGRLVDRAQALIERKIASPNLTPQLVAADLATSRAALYRAFEPFGGVSAVIRDVRLERSRIALALGRPRVAAVAFAHGFRSESQFSRAFKTKFGIQPSAARQNASSPPGSETRRIRESMLAHLMQGPPR